MRIISVITITILLVVLASLMQTSEIIRVFGVKPNVAFLTLGALSVFISSPLIASALVLLSASLLAGQGEGIWHLVFFIALGAGCFLFARRLPWKRFASAAIVSLSGATLFSIIISPSFALRSYDIIVKEFALNILVGALIYALIFSLLSDRDNEKVM